MRINGLIGNILAARASAVMRAGHTVPGKETVMRLRVLTLSLSGWRWVRALVRWWFTDEGPEHEADREAWELQRRQW